MWVYMFAFVLHGSVRPSVERLGISWRLVEEGSLVIMFVKLPMLLRWNARQGFVTHARPKSKSHTQEPFPFCCCFWTQQGTSRIRRTAPSVSDLDLRASSFAKPRTGLTLSMGSPRATPASSVTPKQNSPFSGGLLPKRSQAKKNQQLRPPEQI